MHRRYLLSLVAAAPLLLVPTRLVAADPSGVEPIVVAIADETRNRHHDPATGAAVADRLEAALRDGRFAGITTPEALARRINAEIQAVARDGHFIVMPGAMHAPPVPPTPPHRETPPFDPAELSHLRRVNFGFAAAELLDGNVARLEVRMFFRPAAEVRARLADAMRFLSDSAALIVDLSHNIGGDPHSVALLLSYFFDRPPFVVNRFRWRGRPVESFRTSSQPGGPLYGEARPLVVLVSASTFSAGEEFAYDAQVLRRATIVGQVTGGGANHALPVSSPGGFTAFIPQARAENPVTGANWEGVGVTPDVTADPAAALRTAHRIALERVAEAGDADAAEAAGRALARQRS